MSLWEFIVEKLTASKKMMLLVVVESEGSSPGRQGFKMAVDEDGGIFGTIGGGIMEHKLVEKAKTLLAVNQCTVLLMRQHHDKKQATNQSGMICSGWQLNAFIPLSKEKDLATIQHFMLRPNARVQFSDSGLCISKQQSTGLNFESDETWSYTEKISSKPVVHIVGGGHVGLALSELMLFLGFYIKIYDDRPDVKTLLDNDFAHEKIILSSYESINEYITDCKDDFIVLMTVGYRTDKLVLQKLWQTPCAYLGMLGSDYKVNTLLTELWDEGFDADKISHLFTPIGLNIYSKTSKEIAVSIAAQIILQKNKNLPTGRSKPISRSFSHD